MDSPLGSSPLTRGKPPTKRSQRYQERLIPAHAGKPASSSSPVGALGLIPTHAGKTMRRRHTLRSRRDHPRSRGENFVIEIVSMRTPGSSPLMRGKHGHVSNWQNPHGLIPTHAGKTLARAARSRQRGAHPRSHGENQPRVRRHTPPPGSSPLTRGKPQDVWIERLQERLIPTHAGKTIRRAFRGRRSGAHPHSCGENMVSDGKVSLEDGSSPLTRGKPGSATA